MINTFYCLWKIILPKLRKNCNRSYGKEWMKLRTCFANIYVETALNKSKESINEFIKSYEYKYTDSHQIVESL